MGASGARSQTVVTGVGLSPGVGLGPAVTLEPKGPAFFRLRIEHEAVQTELARWRGALDVSRRQLEAIRQDFESHFGSEHAAIIDAHRLILDDPTWLEEIETGIRERLLSPERALRETAERWLEECRAVGDPLFRERGSDLEDVADRLNANLLQQEPAGRDWLPDRMILVAPSINLSALAELKPGRIAGLVSTRGGEASHLTIVARSCGIPFVGGVEDLGRKIRAGQRLAVDGHDGQVHVDPGPELERSLLQKAHFFRTSAAPAAVDTEPVLTADGRRIHFMVNTEVGKDVPKALRAGAEGVGLFRSEYLYMARSREPVGEREQYEVYRKLAQDAAGLPAYVRTLDIGAEAHPYFSRLAGEEEPVLGLRGIRLSLRHPVIFKDQLRAIVRARAEGDLRIVLPMVSSADEMIQARALLAEVEAELGSEGDPTPIGAMLEVPAAVVALEAIAERSDFLLVGTNDLIQYTLAVGRSNQRAADLFNPFHPAILSSLRRIAVTAEEMGVPTVVCGEVAASAAYSELLIGMGFRRLSMGRRSIARLRAFARTLRYDEARRKVAAILRLGAVAEVEEFVRRELEGAALDAIPQLVGDRRGS